MHMIYTHVLHLGEALSDFLRPQFPAARLHLNEGIRVRDMAGDLPLGAVPKLGSSAITQDTVVVPSKDQLAKTKKGMLRQGWQSTCEISHL